MILDFDSEQSRNFASRGFDVCIIGSGPAGTSLALRLSARGLKVAVLEGGDIEFDSTSQDCYRGDIVGLDYYPLDVARLRYLGGTSGHWGGWCRPLDPHDFAPRPWHPLSGWPITPKELTPYAADAARILDLSPRSSTPSYPQDDDFGETSFRFSRPPTRFGKKYLEFYNSSKNCFLFIKANLKDISLADSLAYVTSVTASPLSAPNIDVQLRARFYVLCLGGIENARALLNCDRQIRVGIGNEAGNVGRFFCEHPVYTIADARLFGEALRERIFIAPTERFLAKHRINNFVVRIYPTYWSQVRTWRQRVKKALCRFGVFNWGWSRHWIGVRSCPDLLAKEGEAVIRISLEQALNAESRVRLTEERDRFGWRRIALNWRLSELDYRTLRRAAEGFGIWFARHDLGRIRLRPWLLTDPPDLPSLNDDEVASFHHMCTTRMAEDWRKGVVDGNCRVFGIDNLYLAGSSVFATSGYANPTFTIVQISLRLADHLWMRLNV